MRFDVSSLLPALKADAERGIRPAGRPRERWLGDFLDQDTPTGLLDTELALLRACATGTACKPAVAAVQEVPDEPAHLHLRRTVEANKVRASFVRFLAVGGDETASIPDNGIELSNALVEGRLNLLVARVVARRLIFTKCFFEEEVSLEDAELGLLAFNGSCLQGLSARRVKTSASVFLSDSFHALGDVQLYGSRIGGGLVCSKASFDAAFECDSAAIDKDFDGRGSSFSRGLSARGTRIAGTVNLETATARRPVILTTADIGGDLICTDAHLAADPDADDKVAFDFSQSKVAGNARLWSYVGGRCFVAVGPVRFRSAHIGGDVSFYGARIAGMAPGDANTQDRSAIEADNVVIGGSCLLHSGFSAEGRVELACAEIAKDLDFSGGHFHNFPVAINAYRVSVAGAIVCRYDPQSPAGGFNAFGMVNLARVKCGELVCEGATFSNPGRLALSFAFAEINGFVALRNLSTRPFVAEGEVNLYSAQIAQHLYCVGGWFSNPGGNAISAQAARVAGCVFLRSSEDGSGVKFVSRGQVDFIGATVGLQLICTGGDFKNATPDRIHPDAAAPALNLSEARIDSLFLSQSDNPEDVALFEGSIDLSNTSVRAFSDGGLVAGKERGLRPDAKDQHGSRLRCDLRLELFSYERLTGATACDGRSRVAWLERQRPGSRGSFPPQPYEQLTKILRALGCDKDADIVAIAKRRSARRRQAWPFRLLDYLFLDAFITYGYNRAKALVILAGIAGIFCWYYQLAYEQGAIVPAAREVRTDAQAARCRNWSPAACPEMAAKTVPVFNPVLYSADVMIPIIGFGQKAAWAPAHDKPIDLPLLGHYDPPTQILYYLQTIETVLGLIGGSLLGVFASGLTAKE